MKKKKFEIIYFPGEAENKAHIRTGTTKRKN